MSEMKLDDILDLSPEIGTYGDGQWAMYSVGCCWWTSFPEDLGKTEDMIGPKGRRQTGLPCCPHCGSVLMQAPLPKFIEKAAANPKHYGAKGLEVFVAAHSRNSSRCYGSWDEYSEEGSG